MVTDTEGSDGGDGRLWGDEVWFMVGALALVRDVSGLRLISSRVEQV